MGRLYFSAQKLRACTLVRKRSEGTFDKLNLRKNTQSSEATLGSMRIVCL